MPTPDMMALLSEVVQLRAELAHIRKEAEAMQRVVKAARAWASTEIDEMGTDGELLDAIEAYERERR
jgi:hypothetical protein